MRGRVRRAVVGSVAGAAALGMVFFAGYRFAKRAPLFENKLLAVSVAPLLTKKPEKKAPERTAMPEPVAEKEERKPISCSEIIRGHKRANRYTLNHKIYFLRNFEDYSSSDEKGSWQKRIATKAVYRITYREEDGRTEAASVKRLYDSQGRMVGKEARSYRVPRRPFPCAHYCIANIGRQTFWDDRRYDGKETNLSNGTPGCAVTVVLRLRNGRITSGYAYGNKPWKVSEK